jgi:hypothetical protein
MTGRKPGTRESTAKSGKRLKLNKQTLKDLAPAKGEAVRGGRAALSIVQCLTEFASCAVICK